MAQNVVDVNDVASTDDITRHAVDADDEPGRRGLLKPAQQPQATVPRNGNDEALDHVIIVQIVLLHNVGLDSTDVLNALRLTTNDKVVHAEQEPSVRHRGVV